MIIPRVRLIYFQDRQNPDTVHIVGPYNYQNGKAIRISLCYSVNPGYVWRLFPSHTFGKHNHDVESIVFVWDDYGDHPSRMFLSAHSPEQGSWVHLDDRGSAVFVYVAKESNAMYYAPGVHARVFNLFNDTTVPSRFDCRVARIYSLDYNNAVHHTLGTDSQRHNDPVAMWLPPTTTLSETGRFLYPVNGWIRRKLGLV